MSGDPGATAAVLSQDPAVFGVEAAGLIRDAVQLRYFLLPALYTLFYRHTQVLYTADN